MDYLDMDRYESKVVPGVVFHLKKLSHRRRIQLTTATAAAYAKINQMNRDIEPIEKAIRDAQDAARIEPCTCTHPLAADGDDHDVDTRRCLTPGCDCRKPTVDPMVGSIDKLVDAKIAVHQVVADEVYPLYIIWGVESIEGFTIQGKVPTPQDLLDRGPESFIAELGPVIQRLIRMTSDEILGFKSPTTSGAQVAGETTGTDAPTANA